MKKYLLGVFAVVLAIGFSAFTKSEAPKVEKKQTVVYLIYNSGDQSVIGSYTQSTVAPTCTPPQTRLCTIRVTDNNGVVTQAEFTTIFNGLDTDHDGTLDDQSASSVLLKKA